MIVALTVLVSVVSAAFGWLNLRTHEAQLRTEMVRGAEQLSRSITSATWHAMRADRRKDAYEVMQTIAEVEGIERIRMLNKDGFVAFSTGNDQGTRVEKSSESCTVCHMNGEPLVVLDAESRCRTGTGADGRRTMSMVTAIHNEPSCGAGGCHPQPTAGSGAEAIERAKAADYALLLLDRQMPPGIDGIETMREVRRLRPDAAFVIVTAYATVDTAVAAIKEGAEDYICKPCNPHEMSLLVERVRRMKSLERAIVVARGPVLDAECFSFLAASAYEDGPAVPSSMTLRDLEKAAIEAALRRTGGNVKAAAAALGIDRSTIYDKLHRHGIERASPAGADDSSIAKPTEAR